MRTIKFRAWDKKEKEMYFYGDYGFVGFAGSCHVLCFEETPTGYIDEDYQEDKKNDLELMQFTGLLDKNGKEIWEGDIVKDMSGDNRDITFEVGGFWCKYPNGGHYLPSREFSEVIGNIYETPELLNKEEKSL
jgi:uncharacterized phage protein (TIGR01671 family)